MAESNFALESKTLPVVSNIETLPLPRDSRERKTQYAQRRLATLEAAIRVQDWKEVSRSAGAIDQCARWLQLTEEQIANV